MKLNTNKILFFISIIILGTIGLQFHWNFKNYKLNKRRLKNEVQIAFDKALEIYFTNESKKTFFSIIKGDSSHASKFDFTHLKSEESTNNIEFNSNPDVQLNSIVKTNLDKIEGRKIKSITVLTNKIRPDNEKIQNRITISMVNDSVNYKKLDSIFKVELNRKEIRLDYYYFEHFKNNHLHAYFNKKNEDLPLKIVPKSSFFNPFESINLKFDYQNKLLLKRMGSELVISLFFALSVISCLFFLLHIIQKQKKIDEIKNDFISNITHEFKTPITTISTALEGMSDFNPNNDHEKNKKYVAISKNQVQKLELMVEKILETATLETESLQLAFEPLDVNILLKNLQDKHQLITSKTIKFTTTFIEKIILGDSFHLENAFSNIIDNAIKYGGNEITIAAYLENNFVIIDVIDNGIGIPEKEEKAIFEKFYRIPTGNIHDVKGYGIGLFYSKNIIEKHNGTLSLITATNTTFRSSFNTSKHLPANA